MNIDINELAEAINDELNRWAEVSEEEIEDIVKTRAKQLVSAVRKDSPVKTGKYKKGWKSRTTGGKGRHYIKVKAYNLNKPEITSLLEDGHRIRSHPNRMSRKSPHIKDNEEKYNALLEKDLEDLFK